MSATGHGARVDAVARICPVCGGRVPEDRKMTCSSECARRYKGRELNRSRRQAKPVVSKASVPAGIGRPANGRARA
jgi:predicted nucleic acid-binding Zn ribbon protein